MNSWEGQMIAIALKELLEAFRALGRDGFGRKDRALLSAVIRDLLTVDPNITRAKATLKAIEALGARPSPDLYVAKNMLAAIQKTRRLLEKSLLSIAKFFMLHSDTASICERSPSTMLKHPSAFLPVAMSLGALATVLVFVALHGTAPQADEGAAAHIWQLLMAAQVPIVLFFAIKWLPQSPRQAVPILGLQVGAALAAMAPVFLLHL